MLFNSLEFAVFLPVVFFYLFVVNKRLRLQNLFIAGVSYFLWIVGLAVSDSHRVYHPVHDALPELFQQHGIQQDTGLFL